MPTTLERMLAGVQVTPKTHQVRRHHAHVAGVDLVGAKSPPTPLEQMVANAKGGALMRPHGIGPNAPGSLGNPFQPGLQGGARRQPYGMPQQHRPGIAAGAGHSMFGARTVLANRFGARTVLNRASAGCQVGSTQRYNAYFGAGQTLTPAQISELQTLMTGAINAPAPLNACPSGTTSYSMSMPSGNAAQGQSGTVKTLQNLAKLAPKIQPLAAQHTAHVAAQTQKTITASPTNRALTNTVDYLAALHQGTLPS